MASELQPPQAQMLDPGYEPLPTKYMTLQPDQPTFAFVACPPHIVDVGMAGLFFAIAVSALLSHVGLSSAASAL